MFYDIFKDGPEPRFVRRTYTLVTLMMSLLAAFVFVCVFSRSTSPFYFNAVSSDAAMFQMIGTGWAEGRLPYVDMWDSKGPLAFFFNAIGHLIMGFNGGTMFLQVIFISLTIFVTVVWIARRLGFKAGSFLAGMFLLILPLNYDGGDMSEEWILPLVALSCFMLYHWTEDVSAGRRDHPPVYALVYGLTFGAALMTRATNAVGVMVGVAFVAAWLCAHRQWRCLLCCAGTFIGGVVVVVAPFVAYFWAHGAVGDMWYAAVGYNISYALHGMASPYSAPAVYKLCVYGFTLSPLVAVMVECLYKRRRMRRRRAFAMLVWAVVPLVTMAYLMSTYGYPHYGMISLPYFCVGAAMLFRFVRMLRLCKVAMVCVLIVAMAVSLRGVRENIEAEDNFDPYPYFSLASKCWDFFPGSFTAYNCFVGVYPWLDSWPVCRYFACQDWAGGGDARLAQGIKKEFAKCKSEWIMVDGKPESTLIYPILNEHYSMVSADSLQQIYLFRKNNSRNGAVE